MKLRDALAQLKALGNETVRARNAKHGAGDNQYGVQTGDIRKLAKTIKADHELGLELWATENIDAMLLAILLISPKKLTSKELDAVCSSDRARATSPARRSISQARSVPASSGATQE